MELYYNNDRLTIYLHASMEAMWMDLKMEIDFGVDIQLEIAVGVRPCVYISKVACETARR